MHVNLLINIMKNSILWELEKGSDTDRSLGRMKIVEGIGFGKIHRKSLYLWTRVCRKNNIC